MTVKDAKLRKLDAINTVCDPIAAMSRGLAC